MRWQLSFCLLICLNLLTGMQVNAKDPLRFYPVDETQLVAVVPKPRLLIESVLNHSKAKEALELPQIKEFLDSADLRRFFQLIAYYEKDLGAKWPELVDQLAGDGITLGTRFGNANAPVLVVLQGREETQVKKLVELVTSLVEDERSRNGATEPLKRKSYQGIEAIEISKDLLFARVGDAILLTNQSDVLKVGIDQHTANTKDNASKNLANSTIKNDVQKLLTGEPLAWLWVNLKPLKALPPAKEVFASPRNDVVQTVLFAGWLDVARRADFIAAGLYRNGEDFKFTVRMPAGRKDTAPDVELHLPKDPKVGGSLPPFDLPGMLACHSFYLDLDTFFSKRDKIFPAQTAKDLGNAEKQLSKVLINSSLPKLLAESGVHHRLVAVQPEKVTDYTKVPETRLPAFAFVTTMRDPNFAKSMNSIVKAAALAASAQVKMKSWEEEIEGVPAFGYSFPEQGNFPDDPQNLRFNYQPTFAAINGQYIMASNKGLCRDLIKVIRNEGKPVAVNPNLQTSIKAKGLSQFTNVMPELPLAGTILSQGIPLNQAKSQTDAFYKFLDSLGKLSIKTEYSDTEFHLDFDWKLSK